MVTQQHRRFLRPSQTMEDQNGLGNEVYRAPWHTHVYVTGVSHEIRPSYAVMKPCVRIFEWK